MSMLVNGKSYVDPHNVPLASLVAQEENVAEIITSTTMLIGTTLVTTTIDLIMLVVMVILMINLECLVRKGW